MTLRATRELDYIVVTAASGPATFSIQEHVSHIGHFWGELGKLLSESEKARVIPYVQVVELPEAPGETEFRNSGTGPGDAA